VRDTRLEQWSSETYFFRTRNLKLGEVSYGPRETGPRVGREETSDDAKGAHIAGPHSVKVVQVRGSRLTG